MRFADFKRANTQCQKNKFNDNKTQGENRQI